MLNRLAYKLGFCLALVLLPLLVAAEDFRASIHGISMSVKNHFYALSADIDYPLSTKANEALQNGVPLYWDIDIHLQRSRHILWDKSLVAKKLRYRLQYHALLNMYRVIDENSGEIHNFSTLPAALELMSSLRDVPLLEEAALVQEKQLLIALRVELDRNALPLPLRPIAYLNRQWYLSSEWILWPWTK